jgi:hypothetical protein
MNFYPCPDNYICDVNYNDIDIAWPNSTKIYAAYINTKDPLTGELYGGKTAAYCVSMEKFKINLLAGRQCYNDA